MKVIVIYHGNCADGFGAAWAVPFAACYWDVPDGRVYSLRSRPEGVDVAEIAKKYGGGGHKNASGFKINIGRVGEI